MDVFAHGFRDLWMGNPCFYFRRFTKMKKHGIKARKEFLMNSIQEMAVSNRFLEGLHWWVSSPWTPKTSIWRHSSCRITYIMRHGFQGEVSKSNAVHRIGLQKLRKTKFCAQNGGVLGVKSGFLKVQLCIDFITKLIQASLFLWLKLAGSV